MSISFPFGRDVDHASDRIEFPAEPCTASDDLDMVDCGNRIIDNRNYRQALSF
jgi:hypothetical protein